MKDLIKSFHQKNLRFFLSIFKKFQKFKKLYIIHIKELIIDTINKTKDKYTKYIKNWIYLKSST